MATLVLQSVGAFAGNIIGGPIGTIIGSAAGAFAGNAIDQHLFGSTGAGDRTGPRLTATPSAGASEGTPIPRVFGRARVGGNILWMTRFEEQAVTTKTGAAGGKGGNSARTTTYQYYANFAVGLCEGPIAGVRRIWADGKELEQTELIIRIYTGGEDQEADPLIVAKEGAENAPAYRGLAYAVFEQLPLDDYGNRLPLLSFEVIRPVGGLGDKITAVCMIPGSSEYAYDPVGTLQLLEPGVSRGENRHQLISESDWNASLDSLLELCPNLQSIALVVAWFGNDLRAGQCSLQPRVELANKTTDGEPWTVAGLDRATAPEVSRYEGKPAFGGTPSDDAVARAIQDIRSRGLEVVFYPFVMMDVPADNALHNPWTGGPSQPAYPWRGRISCDPAPGQPGSVDETSVADAQVDAFFGSAAPSAQEWSYRRFILHYANVCEAAGGVDVFLIGSEMAALTRVRSAPGFYPACNHLAQLAADAATVLGVGTAISYAADWTEYAAHVPGNGDEVRFPLDVLWSQPDIAFVGIDAYWPMSDWRDGNAHLDAQEAPSIYDLEYLQRGLVGGEGYDWYYANASDRDAQIRSPINDGAAGKPWVFRQKDVKNWWSNPHYERVNGAELAQPTGWAPQSKPIWFTEIGCPAVDKGSNAPNVFPDVKSSENAIPHYSSGSRNDLIQKRSLQAVLDYYTPSATGFVEANNPVSSIYAGRMVRADRSHVWAWDARPFPAFPALSNIWSDASAWETGNWINGRIEAAALDDIICAILSDVPGLEDVNIKTRIGAVAEGYIIDRPMTPRSAIEPLSLFYAFNAIVSSGRMIFEDRANGKVRQLDFNELAVEEGAKTIQLVRGQESELSQSISVTLHDGQRDYQNFTTQSRRLEGYSGRQTHMDIPLVASEAEARRRVDIYLQDMWTGRETGQLAVPPSLIEMEVGDLFTVGIEGASRLMQVMRVEDSAARSISAKAIDLSGFRHAVRSEPPAPLTVPAIAGPADIKVLDLAIARSDSPPLQYIAAFADPWPGALAVWRQSGAAGFEFSRLIGQRARIGFTLLDFGPGPVARFDMGNELMIQLSYGALESQDERISLAGNPAIAVLGDDGSWEIINYAEAELVGARQFRLRRLVRGLGGAEHLAQRVTPAGSAVVVLDDAVVPLSDTVDDVDVPIVYRIGPARRPYSDASYVQIDVTASGLPLKPYAPVRATAARTANGIDFTWIRRGRINSDAWIGLDIPLGEDAEAYEIEILQSGIPVRTLNASTSLVTYPAAAELSDFGAQQQQIEINIYQTSHVAGRGFPLNANVPVTP